MRHSKLYSVRVSTVFVLHMLTECPYLFVALIGYWLAPFCAVVFTEHFLFRRAGGPLGGYNLDDWDTPSR